MDKYEISLWEDYPKSKTITVDGESQIINYLEERKLCVIGADDYLTGARAIEPKMVEKVNGTHEFSFKMYHWYVDEITGEKYRNPFDHLLINERKVKVFWKNNWYDMVIKQCLEETRTRSTIYKCVDLYVNELSKNGYSLEFSTDLQNNIGTVEELATSVLEGSSWQFDNESDRIIQKSEEVVYEATIKDNFNANKIDPIAGETTTTEINKTNNDTILMFYSEIQDLLEINDETSKECQFVWAAAGYATATGDTLVSNGDNYKATFTWDKTNGEDGHSYLQGFINDSLKVEIDLTNGVSSRYRAERLVDSQKTEFDPLLGCYANVYKDSQNNEVYGITRTEYSDPLMGVDLITNGSKWTNISGWYTQDNGASVSWGVHDGNSALTISGSVYNTGLMDHVSYFKRTDRDHKDGDFGGICKGDTYIFRYKRFDSNGKNIADNPFVTPNNLGQFFAIENSEGTSIAISFRTFAVDTAHWLKIQITFNQSVSIDEISDLRFKISAVGDTYHFAEIQFFKEQYGTKAGYEDPVLIEPGDISADPVAQVVTRYYSKAAAASASSVDELVYLDPTATYTPVMNNYQAFGTIEAKGSNRFNLLQTIAETFHCWVRFRVEHDETGKIEFDDNNRPRKYVKFLRTVGDDSGISFEYGIDLKDISRTINTDNLATKVIVLDNSNEFAPNGFCSIARASENYLGENFVLDFGYYTQQGLLNEEQLLRDLYSTSEGYISYYYHLHSLNQTYQDCIEQLQRKNMELLKKQSELEVYKQYKLAALQELDAVKAEILTLLGSGTWAEKETTYNEDTGKYEDTGTLVDFINKYPNGGKRDALVANYNAVIARLNELEITITNATSGINSLTTTITELVNARDTKITDLKALHQKFNDKYGPYILEGTWQDESYVDENKYYLDALTVAHNSSRPQINYKINVIRLSGIEEYSSKVLQLGDICYVEDVDFFGYSDAETYTPYKMRLIVSEISSNFDSPEKDTITVQNYRTRFDDLFQRITAATQSLQYAEGQFERAAGAIQADKTLSFSVLQDTFDYNQDLVIQASNQDVTWDSTGITVRNKFNAADLTKILAGGIFVSNDGGATWKNAVRGDGISTNVLTAGRVNTSEVYIYDGNAPTFRWDAAGINAYTISNNAVDFNKFVRFDQYGIYGYNSNQSLTINSISDVKEKCSFGLLWDGFFLKSQGTDGLFEISTTNDLVIKQTSDNNTIERIRIGRENTSSNNYGMWIKDTSGDTVFRSDSNGAEIAGWTLNTNGLSTTKDITIDGITKTYSWGIYAPSGNGDFLSAGPSSGATFKVSNTGQLTATAGTIADWTLSTTGLAKTLNGKTFGIYSPPSTNSNFLQAGTTNSPEFKVTAAGAVTCSNIKITGGSLDINGNATIDSSGNAVFNNLTVQGSSNIDIGNVTIENNTTYAGSAYWGGSIKDTSTNGIQVGNSFIQDYSGSTTINGSPKQTTGVRVSAGTSAGLIATDAGAKIAAGATEVWVSGSNGGFKGTGTFYINDKEVTVDESDYRLKHDIIYDLTNYESLYSLLKPCRFRLNSDNQLRFGFIAQDILEDFLSSVDFDDQHIVLKGLDNYYSLNYSSFIPLNTYMIQKLLKRVSDLESQLAALQS